MMVFAGLAAGELAAKPITLDGYLADAPSHLAGVATHIFSDRPGGPARMALNDRTRELRSNIGARQRLLAEISRALRTSDGLPVLEVIEWRPADWSQPPREWHRSTHGGWVGAGSSLYPSLDPEPVPGPGFGNSQPMVDTDGDGVPDSLDAFPNDPNESRDTDGDGLGDNADPDDDNDTIPDSYELSNGLNPLLADALLDLDFDGLSNLGEFIAGTAANDSGSVLKLGPPGINPPNGFRLEWPTVKGRIYEIHFSPSPDGPFKMVLDPVIGESGPATQLLEPDPMEPTGFYQIQVRPPTP